MFEQQRSSCSPPPTRAGPDPAYVGESSPPAAKRQHKQPVTLSQSGSHGSHGTETCVGGNALNAATSPLSPALSTYSWHTPRSDMTDREIDYEIYTIILDRMECGGVDASHAFEHASDQPPITLDSLAELDLTRIINNPKLRHDVNFDRELHFRPNLDGSKGRAKMKTADQYWKALEGELFMYGFASEMKVCEGEEWTAWQRVLQRSQRRLRKIFEAIRDILKTLVPDHEQKTIMEKLDVNLIMQEITNGVCDLIRLSDWLARVLKAHCAPMRDERVDGMRKEIQAGALGPDHEMLINGLRLLLHVLEAMKLDVANHQIRHMRPLLIDDTINFQRSYNAYRVAAGKINIREAQLWLHAEIEHLLTEVHTPSEVEALTSALVKDLLFHTAYRCPQTFYLDIDRLRIMRHELHSRVYHAICQETLTDLVPADVDQSELQKAIAALHVAINALVGVSGRFCDRAANIAVEITRMLLLLEGRYPPFDANTLGLVEQKLESDLHDSSAAFDKHANEVSSHMVPRLVTSVNDHVRMSLLDLQDALVPALPITHPSVIGFGAVCAPPASTKSYDPDEDLIKRLTHVIVLHWQVWQDMVYLAPLVPEKNVSCSKGPHSRPSSSGSASPTMPVAHAVYAPNRKWLPIDINVTGGPAGMITPSPSPASDVSPSTVPPVSGATQVRTDKSKSTDEPSAHERPAQQPA